jgi:hypothetical protein
MKKLQLSNEVKFAVGMLERRMNEASRIGTAESRHEAVTAFRSMCGAVREIRKHYANVLAVVDDISAGYALEIIPLLETAEKWQGLAREAMLEWGVTEAQAKEITKEMGV